jgi:hypothetical protein
MPPAGGNPTIRASERPLTHALDRAATGIGCLFFLRCDPAGVMASSFLRLYITHDAPQSVGLLWTSDQPDAETST